VKTDAERLVDYHFWSFEQRDAAMLGRQLYREGYLILSISAVEQDGDKVWSVEAQMEHSPEVAANSKQTEELTHLAAKFHSIYDGWGTKI
jgi:regulator of RNase E activity RraB